MRPVVVLALIAGCAADGTVAGTLVFTERDTQHIRLLDLETGKDQLIDSGRFGSVSIAPDAMHVAYAGAERVVKVADRAGTITPILPGGGGCAGTPDWLTSSALVYCIDDSQRTGAMLLPALDGSAPRLLDASPAVSADGTLVAYVNAGGDVIVERMDGGDRRVLVPSREPMAMYPLVSVAAFTPDQRSVVIIDYRMYPSRLEVVALADGATVQIEDAWFGGTPFGAPVFRGASPFSPDGSELVLQSTRGLFAVTLATGAKRDLAVFADRVSSGGAVFLDAERVLWVRVEDHSVSDIGRFTLSLHVAGPGANDDLLLEDSQHENVAWRSIGVSPAGFIALPSENLLVKLDGTVLARNDAALADDILGITPDGAGVIIRSYDGFVRYIGVDGTIRDLATTAIGGGDLLDPYAAYSPR